MANPKKYQDSLLASHEFISGEDLVEIIFNHSARNLNRWAKDIERENSFHGSPSQLPRPQRNAAGAYCILLKLLGLRFPDSAIPFADIEPPRLPPQVLFSFPLKEICAWIKDDGILKYIGFKKPGPRVTAFIEAVERHKPIGGTTEAEPGKSKKDARPAKIKKNVKLKSVNNRYGHSRSDPYGKIIAAIQNLKDKKTPQGSIPWKPKILKLLPKKCDLLDRRVKGSEYKERTGTPLSTVQGLAREVYK